MKKVTIIGAGPAGCLAANILANSGWQVELIERNLHPGQKILATGGGRCNIGNSRNPEDLINHYYVNGKFLFSAFTKFSGADLTKIAEANGLKLKTEDNYRLYPASNQARDVQKFLQTLINHPLISIKYNTELIDLTIINEEFSLKVLQKQNMEVQTTICNNLILACGGAAMPSSGSDGCIKKFAEKLDLTVQNLEPALTSFITSPKPDSSLRGSIIKNIKLSTTFKLKGRKITPEFRGDLIITNDGLSGLPILNISYYYNNGHPEKQAIYLDLFPDFSKNSLLNLWLADKKNSPTSKLSNLFKSVLSKKLVIPYLNYLNIANKTLDNTSNKELAKLAEQSKALTLPIYVKKNFHHAQVTKGGIKLSELVPDSCRCKKYDNLYIIGEAIDICGECGGYNLMNAWATAYTAATALMTTL